MPAKRPNGLDQAGLQTRVLQNARADTVQSGSGPAGVTFLATLQPSMKKEPTEASVLEDLGRGPLRPAAPSMWLAGTPYAATESKTRKILDGLVERGLVEKTRGGWYRLVPSKKP